jgi:predicted transport protein
MNFSKHKSSVSLTNVDKLSRVFIQTYELYINFKREKNTLDITNKISSNTLHISIVNLKDWTGRVNFIFKIDILNVGLFLSLIPPFQKY